MQRELNEWFSQLLLQMYRQSTASDATQQPEEYQTTTNRNATRNNDPNTPCNEVP